MTNEPRWEDIFNQQPDADAKPAPSSASPQPEAPWNPASEFTTPSPAQPTGADAPPPTGQPLTRREVREMEARQQSAGAPARNPDPVSEPQSTPMSAPVAASAAHGASDAVPASPQAPVAGNDATFDSFFASQPMPTSPPARSGSRDGGDGTPPREPKPKRRGRFVWLFILIGLLAAAGGAVAYVWLNYEEQVREVMGWELPIDYEGSGNGEEVIVVIQSGDIGADVAQTLYDDGVTMTVKAFYDLLLQNPDATFLPGNFALQKEMSAQAALDALQDPSNKVTQQAQIPEGTTLPTFLEILANATEIPLADFQAAAATPAAFGVPAEAPSLEGYLFPATYTLEPGLNAQQVLQVMVDRTFQSLDAAGVAPEDRHRVLTIASLVQREARVEGDFYKVSRVVQNRLAIDMKLEFDSTSHYGAESTGSVWTTDEERADDNLYNTYFHTGLPIGPIAAPGDTAIDAALNPEPGPWIFFVAVDLATGETVFTETVAEHERAVAQLRAWCRESDENAVYCS